MDNTSTAFPARLLEQRTAHGWTQEELATHAGLERKSIIRYENGQGIPNAKALIALATVFRVSTDYLLGLTDIDTIKG